MIKSCAAWQLWASYMIFCSLSLIPLYATTIRKVSWHYDSSSRSCCTLHKTLLIKQEFFIHIRQSIIMLESQWCILFTIISRWRENQFSIPPLVRPFPPEVLLVCLAMYICWLKPLKLCYKLTCIPPSSKLSAFSAWGSHVELLCCCNKDVWSSKYLLANHLPTGHSFLTPNYHPKLSHNVCL